MPVEHETVRFIRSSFRSIWSLELLSLLRKSGERNWTPAQLVAALRASDSVVSQSVESLLAAGLIIVDAGNSVRYQPVSDEVDALAATTADLYRNKPDLVRRLIVTGSISGLTRFADAFKIRDD